MVLTFKKRGIDDIKKVLIYGEDGSGKSTFAESYCTRNNLTPICIDIDDTNYTNVPIIDLDLSNDIKAYRNIKKAILEIINDGSYDTIIIDGVTSMLELFVSKAKGLKKYSDRAERFNDILRDLLNSKMHLIFIGQIDMKVIHNEEFQSPKPIIKINSLVNEKYLCYHKKEGYSHKVVKYRVSDSPVIKPKKEPEPERETPIIKEVTEPTTPEPIQEYEEEMDDLVDDFVTADEIPKENFVDDPVRNQCILIKGMLEREGVKVTKSSMRSRVVKLIKEEVLPKENRPTLIKYINKHCPEGLKD